MAAGQGLDPQLFRLSLPFLLPLGEQVNMGMCQCPARKAEAPALIHLETRKD